MPLHRYILKKFTDLQELYHAFYSGVMIVTYLTSIPLQQCSLVDNVHVSAYIHSVRTGTCTHV